MINRSCAVGPTLPCQTGLATGDQPFIAPSHNCCQSEILRKVSSELCLVPSPSAAVGFGLEEGTRERFCTDAAKDLPRLVKFDAAVVAGHVDSGVLPDKASLCHTFHALALASGSVLIRGGVHDCWSH